MKIVINSCFGGFSISKAAAEYMAERGSEIAKQELEAYAKPLDPTDSMDAITLKYSGVRSWYGYGPYERNDPLLVSVVEDLGDSAGGSCAKLCVVEIPDDVEYGIAEYDGFEHVAEKHRTWG